MKKIYWIPGILIVLCALTTFFLYRHNTHIPAMASDLYPLYSGVSWDKAEATSTVVNNQTLTGFLVISKPLAHITDIASNTMPFEQYYEQKLTAAGWMHDTQLDADGPGSSYRVYTKADQYIVLSYMSDFENVPLDSPETCPCATTLFLFVGSL